MTKHTKNQKREELRFTVTFCEDEEENERAFENAVRIILRPPQRD